MVIPIMLRTKINNFQTDASGYTTESGNRWTKISVKMPNVTVGSVIELYYKTQSNLFFWVGLFRGIYPSLKPALSIIPEDFKYKV